jgi:tetratricopeptide (TPR) repeat protein
MFLLTRFFKLKEEINLCNQEKRLLSIKPGNDMKKTNRYLFFTVLILFLIFFLFSCSSTNPTVKDDVKKQLKYLMNQGYDYFKAGLLDKSCSTFESALALAISIDDTDNIIINYLNLCDIYLKLDKIEVVRNYLDNALKISQKEKKEQYQPRIYYLYGRYFESIKDIENAINSYLKSINIAKKDEDKTLALNALGLIYLKDKNFTKALNLFNQAYSINKSKKIYNQLSNNAYNLALVYIELKDYEKALNYAKEALECDKLIENSLNILEDFKLMVRIYEYLNKIDDAIYYINKAINLASIIDKSQVGALLQELERLKSNYAFKQIFINYII